MSSKLGLSDPNKRRNLDGVMSATFLCKRCGEFKGTNGRKRVAHDRPKAGYMCKQCAAKQQEEI
jgi:RNase P subunit RPR2